MPCKEYADMQSRYKSEMGMWAQYTYRENRHLRGGVGDRKAKEIAKEARARASEIGKQMQWHLESCAECKKAESRNGLDSRGTIPPNE